MACKPKVVPPSQSPTGKWIIKGPAVRLVTLPVGAKNKYGDITEHTPNWARIGHEPLAECVRLERPRQSGHAVEGSVRIGGRRYSAFVESDGLIIVRKKS